MQVFISHQITNDEKLASILKDSLWKRGIDGIIAQRKQKYELLIIDKIKNQIESSDYLVALISRYGLASASVHEEIGYAIGKNVPVLLMVDEQIDEQGVLIHGKEVFYFKRDFFNVEADEMAKYIKDRGIPKRGVGKPRVEEIESDEYGKYGRTARVRHIHDDTIDAFSEHGFRHKIFLVKTDTTWERAAELDVFENSKTKQRFFFFPFVEIVEEREIYFLYAHIENWIMTCLKPSDGWLNMCIAVCHGTVGKSLVAKYYHKPKTYFGGVSQNTVISVAPSILYYGLGEAGDLDAQDFRNWNFPSSFPKFFVSKVKSKKDISRRMGSIYSFTENNRNIFKNAKLLRRWEKKHSPSDFTLLPFKAISKSKIR